MQSYSPTKRIWKRMLEYGAIWGSLFGGVMGAVLLLVSIDYTTSPPVMLIVLGGVMVTILGCFGGALSGLLIGLFSGLAMSWITSGYGHPTNVTEYRFAVGLATALITFLVFIPFFLVIPIIDVEPLRNNYVTALIGSVGIAVYASQRVATKYLLDIGYIPVP